MINCDVLRVIIAKGSGDGTLRRISKYIVSGLPYSLSEICDSQQIMCSMGINQEVARNIYESKEKALILQEQLYKDEADMCWIGDDNYPTRLRKLDMGNVPAVLFYKGNYNLLKNKCVGFTGSRKVSESGIRITHSSARQLSSDGITVVSGYAKGVDITAHMAALQAGGDTIFVIVEGILKNRIKGEVKELLNDKNHLFVSQFLPNLTWSAANAMKRNNTIIGLADAMILIESGMEGGTFNAGEQSLKNKKPLFVVEYGVNKPTAEGNTFFLKHGGVPIRGDKNGKPILKRVYSALEQNETEESYKQLSFNFG
ncbi:MAG: DNA-protecting protein DprA [Butyrivibrio sp.]|nr:DNA-protecting protein DprA [Butyrivibrio sp.]